MALRFTDTKKWTDDEWFMGLEPSMKCLWLYMCDMCDHGGVWKINFKQASFSINAILDKQSALKILSDKIKVLSDDKWFIPSFIKFQYPGGLRKSNSAHRGVFKVLDLYKIDQSPYLAPPSPFEGTKDKDKDKDTDKDKVKDKVSINSSKKNTESEKVSGPVLLKRITPDEIVDLWNRTLAREGFNSIPGLGSGKHLQKCLEAIEYLPRLEDWGSLFEKVKNSQFLSGVSDRKWIMPLTWLVDYDNALRVIADEFDEKKATSNLFSDIPKSEVSA